MQPARNQWPAACDAGGAWCKNKSQLTHQLQTGMRILSRSLGKWNISLIIGAGITAILRSHFFHYTKADCKRIKNGISAPNILLNQFQGSTLPNLHSTSLPTYSHTASESKQCNFPPSARSWSRSRSRATIPEPEPPEISSVARLQAGLLPPRKVQDGMHSYRFIHSR